MRLAIKFAYDGTFFSGSQRQPKLKTVEGAIIECLEAHQVIDDVKTSNFQLASRTDVGVSALGNVCVFESDYKIRDILNILNSRIDACWFYGAVKVDKGFNPRHAKFRWYRYHLFNGFKFNLSNPSKGKKSYKNKKNQILPFDNTSFINELKSITQKFEGTHDFSNFVNPQVEKTTRSIKKIMISKKGYSIIIDLRAKSFLWHQVRRLISAWIGVVEGMFEQDELIYALDHPEKKFDFGLAPPKPLFLMDIEYDLNFELDKELLKKTQRRMLQNWQNAKLKDNLFEYLSEKMF